MLMRKLTLLVLSLLFLLLSCSKDEIPTPTSEDPRLVKMQNFDFGTSVHETPNLTRKIIYDEQGRVVRLEGYLADSPKPEFIGMKTYDQNGFIQSTEFKKLVDGNHAPFQYRYEFHTDPQTGLIERISAYVTLSGAEDPVRDFERLLFYNESGELVLDSLANTDRDLQRTRVSYRYYWENGNVVRVDYLNFSGEKMATEKFVYDNRKNPRQWDWLEEFFLLSKSFIPVGKNNIISRKYYDFTGYGPYLGCLPCRTSYRYNVDGFPYLSMSTLPGAGNVIYTYESE